MTNITLALEEDLHQRMKLTKRDVEEISRKVKRETGEELNRR